MSTTNPCFEKFCMGQFLQPAGPVQGRSPERPIPSDGRAQAMGVNERRTETRRRAAGKLHGVVAGDGLWPREAQAECVSGPVTPPHRASACQCVKWEELALVSLSISRCPPQCPVAVTPAGLTNMLKQNVNGPRSSCWLNSPMLPVHRCGSAFPLDPQALWSRLSLCVCLKFLLLPPFPHSLLPGLC